MSTRSTRESYDAVLAILVLVVPLVLWLTVDEDWLHTMAFIVLAVGVAGVFAARWGLRRVGKDADASGRRSTILETIAMAFAASALGAFILLIFMYAG
ncbi:MAG: hypothetical protein SF172_03660 [Burkholderiales bacterium]|nr:hypothetical protein [Burkholderiales bacterium]